jgi:site-specific DNA-methyltransferase (cytosine-N4-specific)
MTDAITMEPQDSSKLSKSPTNQPSRGGPVIPVPCIVTELGVAYWSDSQKMLNQLVANDSVDLIVTSPPFGLVRKKEYGNADADEYLKWFRPFAVELSRVLKPTGSFVINIGGAWKSGTPTKSLYHHELLIMLCKEFGFHLAQEFFWWNPSRLPSPAEWVNVRRIRVKDAVDSIFWLSKTPWPKASNRRVLTPYSDSMTHLLANGYKAKRRPSGHDISENFRMDNGAAIPPNLLAVANTDSNSRYLRYCEERRFPPNPARYPAIIPEFFVRFLTDADDLVIDPFAGSCTTGEVAERLHRRWICAEIEQVYLLGAQGRFPAHPMPTNGKTGTPGDAAYRLARPGLLWDSDDEAPLAGDGGRTRPKPVDKTSADLKHFRKHVES